MVCTMEITKLLCQLLILFLMVCLVLTSDGIETIDVGRYADPVKCYECLSYSHSNNNYCGDPFNASHPNVNHSLCRGQCVKWVRSPVPGVYRYQRTCSDNLRILMTIHLVCMEESRPGTGRICFCEKNDCNAANSIRKWNMFFIVTVTLLLKIVL
ncbi:protein quiver-like [Mytilus californianus]|uniref:protein quiver-like n=1 Tax=Mytilus californianus TaxID=6549 RepID=UPI0022454CFE|nr:protein quiver-like [Mytilus californianus]